MAWGNTGGIILIKKIIKKVEPYLYLTPAMILYGFFFLAPFFYSLYISFTSWDLFTGETVWLGLENYRTLINDHIFWRAIKNTLIYVVVQVPLAVFLGLLYAILIEKTRGKVRNIFRFIFFIPIVFSVAAAGLSFTLMFSPSGGFFNQILAMLGIQGPNWLNQSNTALIAIIIVGVWRSFGYNVILYIAGLKQIDDFYYEAAEIDGASTLQKFWYITWPQLTPVTFFVFVMTMLFSFRVFDTVQIMTMGGPSNATNVMSFYVWQEAFKFFNTGVASAAATILFLAMLLLTLFVAFKIQKGVHYQ